MMQTYQIDLNTARPVGQLPNNIRDALDGHILQIPVQKIVLFQHDRRIAVQGIHLRRCHHDTSHTVVAADVDLMCLWDEHPDMNDIPVPVGGSIEFQFSCERQGIIGIRDGDDGSFRIKIPSDLFQHDGYSNPLIAAI